MSAFHLLTSFHDQPDATSRPRHGRASEDPKARVIIDMTISLDGYVAGPDDGAAFPLGKHSGRSIFDWYTSGVDEYRSPLFKPAPGANLDEVKRMFDESGAFVFDKFVRAAF
jgi:hypothetical protein